MSAFTRMQICKKFIPKFDAQNSRKTLKIAFLIYAVCCLLSMATMSVGAAILFLAILVTSTHFSEWKAELNRKPTRLYLIWGGALIVAIVLSLISAIAFPLSYANQYSEVHFFREMVKCWYLIWPFVLVVGLRRLLDSERETVLKTWLGTFTILSVIGIFQYFTAWPRGQGIPGEPTHYHATLFLGHHLSVASILIFPFFAALDRAWTFGFLLKKPKHAIFYGIAAALGLGALYFTYSRTLWLALPVGILIWTLWRLPRKWAALGALILGSAVGLATQYGPIAKRIHDSLGTGTREALWLANWEFFKNRPLAGAGWLHNHELSAYYLIEKSHNTDVFAGHAHNNLLDMLGGMGLIGTFAWLGFCAVILWTTFRKKSSPLTSSLSIGWVCAWIVFHINGLTQVNFWEAKVQHQIAWVIAWTLL